MPVRSILRFVCLPLLLTTGVRSPGVEVNLRSPDGRIAVTVVAGRDNEPGPFTYEIRCEGRPMVERSALGLVADGVDWSQDVVLAGVTTAEHDATWQPVYGERSEIRDHYREAIVTVQRPGATRLELLLRVYDEGVAFRYRFRDPAGDGAPGQVTAERTQFVLPAGTRGWFTPAAQATYQPALVESFRGSCDRPLTLALPDGWHLCLTEAALVDFARMQFVADETDSRAVRCALDGPADLIAPASTPWRVIMIAEEPGRLIENNFLPLNLNPPGVIADASWIKPGKAMRDMGLSTVSAMATADFCAAHGIEYLLLDAGWYGPEFSGGADATRVDVDPQRNPRNDLDLAAVIAHAAAKGVGVWLYVNQLALTRQLDEILPLYESWGVKGVKFGFVDIGSARAIAWLHDAVRQAAAHHLMVDIHDDYRPTGFSRTWPHLLTQEGVRGNEEFPDATHNATLPFTRFVAGAADYTICYYRRDFGEGHRGRFLQTTAAHQLSLAVICYSPFQLLFWYDRPEDYRGEPEIEFFEEVPTVWDETRVLQGEIGECITMARRRGDEWFVGTITNNEARSLDVPLGFLPPGRKYLASIYRDDPNAPTRTKVGIDRVEVDSVSVLRAELQPSGGQAIWLRPVEDQRGFQGSFN